MSIDASELEGLSEDELRRKYDAHSRGSAGVPGAREDFSDMVAKEMAKKKQKMEKKQKRRRALKISSSRTGRSRGWFRVMIYSSSTSAYRFLTHLTYLPA